MNINILENSYRLINKYNQKTKHAKTYGTEDLLYVAEVHMIEIIGSYEQITTTKLANILGITKGAVSQTTNKLLKKGLIEKRSSTERTNEVFILLSESGKTVFEHHRNMHKQMLQDVEEVLATLPPEGIGAVEKIMKIMDQSLDEM